MEANNSLKGYEQRICSLNAELNSVTNDNSELREKQQSLKAENFALLERLSAH